MTYDYFFTMDSTNVVEIHRLRDVDRAYLRDATGTANLVDDESGDPISGAQNIPATYIAGVTADRDVYRFVIPANVTLVKDAIYDARVRAVAQDGSERLFHARGPAVEG